VRPPLRLDRRRARREEVAALQAGAAEDDEGRAAVGILEAETKAAREGVPCLQEQGIALCAGGQAAGPGQGSVPLLVQIDEELRGGPGLGFPCGPR
jgi:hypothetical protein